MARYQDRAKNAIMLGSLDSPGRTEIIKADSSFELSAGHLLFQRDGNIYAQPFDSGSGRVSGDARPIVEGVVYSAASGRTAFSASVATDTLVYRPGRVVSEGAPMQWFDMTGKALGVILAALKHKYGSSAFRPMGRGWRWHRGGRGHCRIFTS